MMHRREFLATTAALAAAPRFAWGQAKRRVAIVVPTAPVSELYKGAGTDYGAYGLFIEGLEEHGWVEGQNLAIERYSAVGKRDLVPALAQAVVSSGPDVIFTRVGRTLVAIMDATDTIPVVAIINARFVERYVESLARPGGNLTGLTSSAGTGIQAKRLQLLHQAVPTITRVWRKPGSSRTALALPQVPPEHRADGGNVMDSHTPLNVWFWAASPVDAMSAVNVCNLVFRRPFKSSTSSAGWCGPTKTGSVDSPC